MPDSSSSDCGREHTHAGKRLVPKNDEPINQVRNPSGPKIDNALRAVGSGNSGQVIGSLNAAPCSAVSVGSPNSQTTANCLAPAFAKVNILHYGETNKPTAIHDRTFYFSSFEVEITGASIPVISITVSHPSLVSISCPWTGNGSGTRGPENGIASCVINNAFGVQGFSIGTSVPINVDDVGTTFKCDGVKCE